MQEEGKKQGAQGHAGCTHRRARFACPAYNRKGAHQVHPDRELVAPGYLRAEILDLAKLNISLRRDAAKEDEKNAQERIKLEQAVAKENEQFVKAKMRLESQYQKELLRETVNQKEIYRLRFEYNDLLKDHDAKIKEIEATSQQLIDNNMQQIDYAKYYMSIVEQFAQLNQAWAESAAKRAEEAHQRELALIRQKMELELAYREFQQFNLKEVLKLTTAAETQEALEDRRQTTQNLYNLLREVGISEETAARLRIRYLKEAQALGVMSMRSRTLALVYVMCVFFGIPFILIFLSRIF